MLHPKIFRLENILRLIDELIRKEALDKDEAFFVSQAESRLRKCEETDFSFKR